MCTLRCLEPQIQIMSWHYDKGFTSPLSIVNRKLLYSGSTCMRETDSRDLLQVHRSHCYLKGSTKVLKGGALNLYTQAGMTTGGISVSSDLPMRTANGPRVVLTS